MDAFIAGVIFGFLFAGSISVAIYTHSKRPRKTDTTEWEEDHYNKERLAKPIATTKVSIHERTIQL